VSKGLWQENEYLERGSRQRSKMVDLVDEDPDGQDLLEDEIRREGDKAVALRNKYKDVSSNTSLKNDNTIEGIDQDDPIMKQLLAEMGHDNLEEFLNDDGDFDESKEFDAVNGDDEFFDNFLDDKSTKDLENISQDEIIKIFDSVRNEKEREEKNLLELQSNNNNNDDEFENKMKQKLKKEPTKIKKLFANNDVNDFTDPFQDKDYSSSASLRTRESRSKDMCGMLNLLDERSEESDKPAHSGKVLEDNNQMPANFSDELALFNNNNDDDKEKSVGKFGLESLNTRSLTDSILDDNWDKVEFGRAPDPDYSIPRGHRIQYNINMAEKVFADMQREGIKPDIITLTSFLSVYSEALRCEEATEIFNSVKNFDLQPSSLTYRSMIRMCIRNKDINSAIHYKEDMIENGITPDGEIYGMLIESYAHRNMIVESLKLLEEVDDRTIKVQERHIKKLRARCEKLGFEHPSMPANPLKWVKRLKQKRSDTKLSSQRRIEPVRSKMFV
jgi:pentatricopeptide repeat protein